MSESPQEVVSNMYDAFARGDVQAILSTVDDGIDWRVPANLPHGGHFTGRDGVAQFFQGIGDRWNGLTVDVEDVIGQGDRVVVLASVHGKLNATGEDTGYFAAHIWTLRDARPVRFAETVDAPLTLPAATAAS